LYVIAGNYLIVDYEILLKAFSKSMNIYKFVVSVGGAKLTTHLYLMLRLRMRGAIPPIPPTSSWRGAQLSIGYVFM
jgi:hypothetical protein